MKTLNKNNENRILGPIKMNCLRQERKNECDDEHRRTSTEGKKNQSMWKNLFMKIRFFCFHIHENLSGNPHKCTLRLIFRSFEKALMTSLWREKYCLTLVFTRELLKLIVSIKKENCVEDLLNSHCVRRTLLPLLASSVGRNKTEPKRVRGMIPQSHHGAIFGEHITYEWVGLPENLYRRTLFARENESRRAFPLATISFIYKQKKKLGHNEKHAKILQELCEV